MYEGAKGNVTASSLNDKGEWSSSYSLRLDDKKSIDLFKEGIASKNGLFRRILWL
jgi:hypothetical protein